MIQKPRTLIFIAIFILAIAFRLINYENRISVENDNSRDVSVAQYARDHKQFFFIGQYSSAGPFFYGPWWYWTLTLVSFLPLGPLTIWYFTFFLSLLFLLLLFRLGSEIGGYHLGLIALLLGSISPAQIGNATAVWNPVVVPLLSVVILYFLVKYLKTTDNKYSCLSGFFLGLAISIHFQSLLLLPVVLPVIFLAKNKLKTIFSMFFYFSLPFLTLVMFDLMFNWINIRSLWHYLTVGQYAIWVPNRWLTYALDYWPKTWAFIIGGSNFAAFGFLFLWIVFGILSLTRIKRSKLFLIVSAVFALEIILYRYYRGERFSYYSYFAHPYVLMLSAWILWRLIQLQKIVGWVLFVLVVIMTWPHAQKLLVSNNISYPRIVAAKEEIYAAYRGENFSIFGCSNLGSVSHPLAFFIYRDGRNNSNGIKIGTCESDSSDPVYWREIQLAEISPETNYWLERNVARTFHETVEWWKDNPPK